ncbi:MAG: transglycosylase domain-containing protein [Anaerolineae bacterium]|nr:transglycosylase domain-containing protein [Anaerolineae bacterium]
MPDEKNPRDPEAMDDDETEAMELDLPLDVMLDDDKDFEETDDVPFPVNKPHKADSRLDPSNLPTMPIPREPGSPDYNKTMPGSHHDEPDYDQPEHTAQHQSPQQTMAHMPVVQNDPYQRRAQAVPPPPRQAAAAPARPALPARQSSKRPRRILGCSPTCLMVFVGLIATFCGGLTLLVVVVSGVLGSRVEQQLSARVATVDEYQNFESTFFYDRHGELLYEAFDEGRRTNVKLANIPQVLIDATIAIEDDNFYDNPGIDVPATTRAFLQYVGLAEGDTGGSTITQQLVRNVLFDPEYRAERSVQRKLEEIGLALALTRQKSKDEILELYLNEIYYGNLSYGAAAAARTFFDKDVSQLTLGEAALLAGLPQSPAELDPLNPDPSVQAAVELRWRTVLDRMVTEGYISDDQRNEALRQGLSFEEPDVPFRAPHFTVFARQELEQRMIALGFDPEEIARGGLKVYTTLDLRINEMAQQAVREQIARLAGNNVSNGAVLVTKPLTGEILAMVGSADYNNDAIDGRVNVTISPRQPGSTMKPMTYSAAIELGMNPGEVLWDTPLDVTGPGVPANWPVNYDGRYHGPMRMRNALANSYNIPAVATLRRIGVDNLLEIAQRFGVRSLGNDSSRYGLSLTLGGGEVTLLELVRAYSVFANQGTLVPTTSILCIANSDGNILYEYEDSCPQGQASERTVIERGYGQQVLDPRIAFLISDILGDNVARSPAMGSNSPLRTDFGASVKTGTTDNVKDNWTIGYTPNVAVGVWVGNSNGDPMVNSSGLTGAAPIWNAVISSIYGDQSLLDSFATDGRLLPNQLSAPQGISQQQLCDLSAMADPVTDCRSRVTEWLLDSPAGIPNADGTLNYPPVVVQQPQQVSSGPNLVQAEPGIYRVLVHRLPSELASQITFSLPVGQAPPPTPLYCQVPVELEPTARSIGATEQLFITPPVDAKEAVEAENFARSANLAFLPSIACSPELLQGGATYGPNVVTAVINSPQPGAVLTGETPIIGTVQFSRDQAQFYKVEIIGGQYGGWTTVGSTHSDSIVNGQLENLYVPALESGSYRIRLAIVDWTGGFLQAPYEVPFSVQ